MAIYGLRAKPRLHFSLCHVHSSCSSELCCGSDIIFCHVSSAVVSKMPDKDSALVFSTLKVRHVVSHFRTFGVELIHEKLVLLSMEMLHP